MSEDKKRVCGTCAWWESYGPMIAGIEPDRPAGDCCYDPAEVQKGSSEWCRHHAFTTGWEEEEQKRPDTEYVQFLERLRKGPPPEEEEDRKGNDLGESIDHDSGRQVSMDQIKALEAKIEQARWLIDQAALWVSPIAITAEGQYWRARRDKWLAENGQDEDGPLPGAIDYNRGRSVSQDEIKALQEQLKYAHWLIARAMPSASARSKEREWYISRDAWIEKQDYIHELWPIR